MGLTAHVTEEASAPCGQMGVAGPLATNILTSRSWLTVRPLMPLNREINRQTNPIMAGIPGRQRDLPRKDVSWAS